MAKKVSDENVGKPIPYDPDFKGPLKNRSCTDIICLLLFLVFVACWVAIGIWAIKNGDPNTLLVPRDSEGRRCGLDTEVKDLPYLFFFDLTKCISPTVPFTGCNTPQVCVTKCPTDNFWNTAGNDTSIALPYCRLDHRTVPYEKEHCPEWFLKSESFQKRCIPSLASINENTIEEIGKAIDNSGSFLANIQSGISNIKLLSEAEQVAQQVIADIMAAWWKILIGVAMALVACIIYILMLRWIAGIMVWASIIGVVAALGAATYFSYAEWRKYVSHYNDDPTDSYKTRKNIFLAIFIIVVVILAIVLLVLIFLRKRIVLAIALIKEGSRAVSSVTSVLFFPIIPWILQIGVVAYAICVGGYLATTGDPLYQMRNVSPECKEKQGYSNGTICNPSNFTANADCAGAICKFSKVDNEAIYPYLQAFNIFGFFWLAFFVSALGQMVLAQVFAQWYWTFRKSNLPFFAITAAFYRTIRYHLGTLAFGSLIIAICRMIRVCLEYVDQKLKQYDNEFTKAILCCLKCFFWCLEKFLKFINKNAYIMCAIHGKNFCASAKDAFMLLMRNIIRVFVLDKITDFLFFLSKLLVTVGVGAVAYVFFATDLVTDNSNLNYGVVPVIIIMIVTYLVASLFFSVYSMAVDTLFLCFLEDCERNDGTPDKPYYMSKNLMKIFGKRNKSLKHE